MTCRSPTQPEADLYREQMVDIKYERSNEKVNSGQMLNLYEVTNFRLTYFHMTGNVILKTGNLSVCQAVK